MNDKNTIEDQNLIKLYQNCNVDALNQLIKKYYQYIYKVLTCYRKIPGERAQDYTQDICLRLIQSLKSLKIETTFKKYLDRMINNKAIDDHRETLRNKNIPIDEDIQVDPSNSFTRRELYLKLEQIIKDCLSKIKHKKMQQLVNFWINGYRGNCIKRKDMARLLNVKIGYVNGTLERGKAIFRDCVKKNYEY